CSGSPNITGKDRCSTEWIAFSSGRWIRPRPLHKYPLVGDTLVFEIANKRQGELRLSPDGKTLIEKGDVRRTFSIGGYFSGVGGVSIDRGRHGAHSGQAPPQMTGFTACVGELTGTFTREK